MPTIAQLNHRNKSSDPAEAARLRALYEGGQAFRGHLHKFLPQRPMENPERYQLRKTEAVYRNYLGPIIDYFTSLLFTSKPVAKAKLDKSPVDEPGDYYDGFREDCDRNGADVDAVLKHLLTDALIEGHAWLRVGHASDGGEAPASLAEFEGRKLGDSWVQRVESSNVIDWETDGTGALKWAIVYSRSESRISISDTRNMVTERWEYLTNKTVEAYEVSYPEDKRPDSQAEVPRVDEYPHRYGAVPLHCLSLPAGLWIANRLENPQLGHFRLSNAQTWGMTATCYAMSVVKVNDPEAFQKRMAMGAGYGFTIKPDEEVGWTAPPTGPFEALGDAIASHKDEIYRIADSLALGVDNNAAAVGRSAESKQSDAEATRVVLLAYARVVKEFLERLYDTISRARGDQYTWTVSGLDDFAAKDLDGLVDVLERIDKFGGIPSRTFQIQMMRRLVESMLPDLEDDLRKTIREELEAGVGDQSAEAREAKTLKVLQKVRGSVSSDDAELDGQSAAPAKDE